MEGDILDADLALGSTVWVEHSENGDIAYRVKFIHYRIMTDHEICKVCHVGHLSQMGTLIQYGILDDKIYTVAFCPNCKNVTVFISFVTAQYWRNQQEGDDHARANQ